MVKKRDDKLLVCRSLRMHYMPNAIPLLGVMSCLSICCACFQQHFRHGVDAIGLAYISICTKPISCLCGTACKAQATYAEVARCSMDSYLVWDVLLWHVL
jgi:hypothetical protein